MDRSLSLVLFDVGNVLIRLRPWQEVLPLEKLPPHVDREALVEELRASELLARFENGKATVGEFYAGVRRIFSSELPDAEIRSRHLELLDGPVDGMEALLGELKSRGLRIAALTNTNTIHREVLANYSTVALLERVVASCELGVSKPDPEAFEGALRVLGAEPASTLFTDDRPENVEAARKLGMKAHLFESAASLRRALGMESAR